jgi:hypothetical protein
MISTDNDSSAESNEERVTRVTIYTEQWDMGANFIRWQYWFGEAKLEVKIQGY